ncbi:Als2 [Symbiodinium necroappetens]|uniref:Als2 protein n=1 Tax=Symbiodinium necroappetens TaxID=1628268 RepID=A0A812S9C0_9DINO|nr:Als2 [Symbiodinium necroappetens]
MEPERSLALVGTSSTATSMGQSGSIGSLPGATFILGDLCQKHGQGVLNKTDGTQYTGSWAHGLYSGEGTLSLPSGERYVGGFRAHKFHGRGVHDQPSKAMHYEGHFEVGLRHGYGELQERDGASTYVGDFQAGRRHGVGKACDQVSGISYEGPWVEDQPECPAAAWDLCPVDAEESYLAVAELLKEEAANQLAASNPKDKKKGKPPPPVDTTGAGPELKGLKGQALPETVVRLVDASKAVVPAEVGRRFRITMYKERRGSEDPEEVLRRPVNFGDLRQTLWHKATWASEQVAHSSHSSSPPPWLLSCTAAECGRIDIIDHLIDIIFHKIANICCVRDCLISCWSFEEPDPWEDQYFEERREKVRAAMPQLDISDVAKPCKFIRDAYAQRLTPLLSPPSSCTPDASMAANCLYHRTIHDAAFSILEDAMFRGHGKDHCYFSGGPFEDEKVESGCEIFMTESDLSLWSRTGGAYAADYYGQGDESPARAEADEPIDIVLGQGSSSADAPTDDPQQPPLPAATEGTLAILDAVPPIEVDLKEPERERNATDESMPSVTEGPTVDDGTLITPSNLTATTSYISNTTATHVVNDVDGVPVETYSEKVKPPEPIPSGGTEDQANQYVPRNVLLAAIAQPFVLKDFVKNVAPPPTTCQAEKGTGKEGKRPVTAIGTGMAAIGTLVWVEQQVRYVDPLDEADAPKAAPKKGGKSSPVPDEDAEPPNPGVEELEGRIEEGGRSIIGGTDEWLLPVHLQPALYWLRLEDVTELEGSIWPRLEPLELPFRVE